jgi:hypothetical protein
MKITNHSNNNIAQATSMPTMPPYFCLSTRPEAGTGLLYRSRIR